MDSVIELNWHRANIIDNRWRKDVLPPGELEVPLADLPESDCGEQGTTLLDQKTDGKWNDVQLAELYALAQ